jgi:hypothetical protein
MSQKINFHMFDESFQIQQGSWPHSNLFLYVNYTCERSINYQFLHLTSSSQRQNEGCCHGGCDL